MIGPGRPSRGRCFAVVSALLAGVCTIGCDLGAPVTTAPAGTISGVISYAGSASGALVVEAHDALPPVGPPVALTRIEDAVFAQEYLLEGLDPEGTEVFLTARLAETHVIGTYPSVLEVSPVVLERGAGLRGASFPLLDETPAGPVAVNEARTVSGVVRYDGLVLPGDKLRGALYRTYPAQGAPAGFQVMSIDAPAFPLTFSFTEVADGTYFTVFYLDRYGDSPFGPGPEDRVAWALDPAGAPIPSSIQLGAGVSGADVSLPSP